MTSAPTVAPDRLHALDSLRGVAAFVVMLGHCVMIAAIDPPDWIGDTPLRLFVNGHAGVIIFFVLSGYVLSIPFWKGVRQPYVNFMARRLCRIYLPFAAAIVVAALLYAVTPKAIPGLGSEWFHYNWKFEPVTLKVMAEHLIMTGRAQDMWLNPIMWSLVYELRVSLIFPLLWLMCRNTMAGSALALAAFTMAALAMGSVQIPALQFAYHVLPTLLLTLYYAAYFMLGILLAKHHRALEALLKRLPPIAIAGLFLLALVLLDLPKALHSPSVPQTAWMFIPEALLGLGAGLLIVLVRSFGSAKSTFNPLRLAPVEWLGKVSYSLYLLHYPIAFFVARRLLGEVPFPLIVAIIVAASLAASGLFYFAIERPSMALGRRLAVNRRAAFA